MDDLLRSILDPGEMTFTIEDADMDKLFEIFNDINIKDCPYFEIRDKYGNFAKYYREDQLSAQPEIIRCRDCRYSTDFYQDGCCYCKIPSEEMRYIGEGWDFYCADAERRTV